MPKSFLNFFSLNERMPRPSSLLLQRHHVVVEPWNPDAAAAVFHLGDELRQDERGVGDRRRRTIRMQIGAAATQVNLEIHQTAQAVTDGRHAAREHLGVSETTTRSALSSDWWNLRRRRGSRRRLPLRLRG